MAGGLGLVPGALSGAAQCVVARSRGLHQVAGAAVVRHCVVVAELASQIDPVSDGARVPTADHWERGGGEEEERTHTASLFRSGDKVEGVF